MENYPKIMKQGDLKDFFNDYKNNFANNWRGISIAIGTKAIIVAPKTSLGLMLATGVYTLNSMVPYPIPPAPPGGSHHDWTGDPYLQGWNDAESAQETPPVHYDPLVLDLNRDGKINLDNATFFDLNASGFHEYTRWISETDAFLVLDINGNGKIDNGSEMFGDSMRLPDGSIALSGFDALRSYDTNGDGKIDANDDIFSSLKLLTGAGQLVTLADAGVKSINIPDRTRLPEFNASALPRDERIRQDYQRWLNGGVNATHGSFEWDDGTEGAIDEVLPYRIPMYSIPDAKWDVPDEIAALPNLFGQGVLYDLQQIMAIDGSGELRGILEQYMSEKDPQKREALMTQLLYKWAGVDEIDPNSRGGLIDKLRYDG